MTIGIISNPKHDAQYKKIISNLGHQVKFLDITKLDWQSKIDKWNKQVDIYFWHSIDRGRYYQSAILGPLKFIIENTQHKVFPDYNQYSFYNDKVKQTEILKQYKINHPKIFYTTTKTEALNYIKKIKYPFVLKDPHSASSLGVYLVKTKTEAKKFIDKIFNPKGLNSLYSQFYAQKFIPGLDKSLRVITIGCKVYCAYWRTSLNDWRHRLDKASVLSDENIPPAAKKLCTKLAKKMKFHWMSWDLLVKKNKIYLIEFSCNFGTKGAEKLGYNPKKEIIKYIIKYK